MYYIYLVYNFSYETNPVTAKKYRFIEIGYSFRPVFFLFILKTKRSESCIFSCQAMCFVELCWRIVIVSIRNIKEIIETLPPPNVATSI